MSIHISFDIFGYSEKGDTTCKPEKNSGWILFSFHQIRFMPKIRVKNLLVASEASLEFEVSLEVVFEYFQSTLQCISSYFFNLFKAAIA